MPGVSELYNCLGHSCLPWIGLCFHLKGFPGGSDSKESACNAGDPVSIPGSGRCPGEEYGTSVPCILTPVFSPRKIQWTEEPGGL